jgi:hypothetical protein
MVAQQKGVCTTGGAHCACHICSLTAVATGFLSPFRLDHLHPGTPPCHPATPHPAQYLDRPTSSRELRPALAMAAAQQQGRLLGRVSGSGFVVNRWVVWTACPHVGPASWASPASPRPPSQAIVTAARQLLNGGAGAGRQGGALRRRFISLRDEVPTDPHAQASGCVGVQESGSVTATAPGGPAGGGGGGRRQRRHALDAATRCVTPPHSDLPLLTHCRRSTCATSTAAGSTRR